jgi:glycosyltransferase involved in cell wall biosynthesis
MKQISVVIPTLNEEGNIIPISSAIIEVLQKYVGKYDYEIIIIDNHSTDKTRCLIRELCQNNKKIKAIFNSRNFGPRSSIYGLTQASGDCVIKISADFQDPVEFIDDFISEWENGYKIVIGVKEKSQENKFINFIRSCYYRLIKQIAEIDHIEQFSGFGLYDKDFIEIIRNLKDPIPYFRGIIAELGFEYKKIPYQQPNRRAGKSKYNFYKLYDYAMLGITSYSKVFIRLATMAGGIIAMGSLLIGLVYFVLKLIYWNRFDAGFAPMIIGMFFLGAIQLLFLGIIGEYILSINTRALKRPLVVEEEKLNFTGKNARINADFVKE